LGTHSSKLRFKCMTDPVTRTRYRIADNDHPHSTTIAL
jgi:hypothetical protein